MYVTKEFSLYCHVIRNTCKLKNSSSEVHTVSPRGKMCLRNSEKLYSFLGTEIACNRYISTARASLRRWYVLEVTRGQMLSHVFFWLRRRHRLNQNGRRSSWTTEINIAHVKELIQKVQTCDFVACRILSSFVTRHCSARFSACVTVNLSLGF
jgi:hypothetical protein